MSNFAKEIQKVKNWKGPPPCGKVTQVLGVLIETTSFDTCVDEICYIFDKNGRKRQCQVVGFKENRTFLMPLEEVSQILPGAQVVATDKVHRVGVSFSMRGRILDGLGSPIDGKGEIIAQTHYPVYSPPPPPLKRERILKIFPTGIKTIDAFLTIGRGQRVGIFSEAGVGKSSLLSMIAKNSSSDINVIALIGERGKEVRDFIERDLGKEGLEKSIIVVSTSDQMASLRANGAQIATSIAEYFRDLGMDVLLMVDSISRFAMALREIALARHESSASADLPPSLFSSLARLTERAGCSDKGSITAFYTILEEKKGFDPVAAHMRALLDGHVILSKKEADAHHFPAIDILSSLSRVMTDIVKSDHLEKAAEIRSLLQAYKEAEELIEVGAYVPGTNPKVDRAQKILGKISLFLQQGKNYYCPMERAIQDLLNLE
jgi:flagellum-specific ATP synthase